MIETNPGEGGQVMRHLHFVLFDPDPQSDETVIVNIETLTSRRQDITTILGPDDHEWIDHESYVCYKRAQIVTVGSLREKLEARLATRQGAMSADLLERVRMGLQRSPHTKIEVVEFYADRFIPKAKR